MTVKKNRFAIIGLGFISERHMRAIEYIGGKLVWACDTDESKTHKIDSDVKFTKNYKEIPLDKIDYVVICTPNHLHYEMCKFFHTKRIICEKPLVTKPSQINGIPENTIVVHQLRFDKYTNMIKNKVESDTRYNGHVYKAQMNVEVHRDQWYWDCWKGKKEQSGGFLYNIGVHYFDLLVWLFGEPESVEKTVINGEKFGKGVLKFKNAVVKWKVRLDAPIDNQKRQLILDKDKFNLNRNFENLHDKVYLHMLQDHYITPERIRPTLKLIETIYESAQG